jgi:hypothetical protein
MTRTTTLKFVVSGDSYDELTSAADAAISKFLRAEDDDYEFDEEYESSSRHNVNYEIVVSEAGEMSSEYEYTAEVIARIKDVR